MEIKFVKMHGLGNDFIIMEDAGLGDEDYSALAKELCLRRWSVGGDGLVVLQDSTEAEIRMRIFNPDGSEAEMCGNALGCVASYYHEREGKEMLKVETGAGLQDAEIVKPGWIKVNMGIPKWESGEIPVEGEPRQVIDEKVLLEGEELIFTGVSMGNPHCVVFVEGWESVPWEHWGAILEKHPIFPQGVNVEFVKINNSQQAEVMVWERGAGKTLACGSGACAVAAAGIRKGLLGSPVEVQLPGGLLRISWKPGEEVWMEGPAEVAYWGKKAITQKQSD